VKLAIVPVTPFQQNCSLLIDEAVNKAALARSIRENLFPLGDDVAFVPGHGPMSTFGRERESNPYVSDRALGITIRR